jgi:hypothetical protein
LRHLAQHGLEITILTLQPIIVHEKFATTLLAFDQLFLNPGEEGSKLTSQAASFRTTLGEGLDVVPQLVGVPHGPVDALIASIETLEAIRECLRVPLKRLKFGRKIFNVLLCFDEALMVVVLVLATPGAAKVPLRGRISRRARHFSLRNFWEWTKGTLVCFLRRQFWTAKPEGFFSSNTTKKMSLFSEGSSRE